MKSVQEIVDDVRQQQKDWDNRPWGGPRWNKPVVPVAVENNRVAAWADGHRAVVLIIRRQSGANILDVIDRI